MGIVTKCQGHRIPLSYIFDTRSVECFDSQPVTKCVPVRAFLTTNPYVSGLPSFTQKLSEKGRSDRAPRNLWRSAWRDTAGDRSAPTPDE